MKVNILNEIENKSTREVIKVLAGFSNAPMPETKEITIQLTQEWLEKLNQARALLGVQGAGLSFEELLLELTNAGLAKLQENKFGKNRVQNSTTPAPVVTAQKHTRYTPKSVQYEVWQRDKAKCVNCGSQNNVQLDHSEVPFAFGGLNSAKNLRLLCFHCNQRSAIKIFGLEKIKKHYPSTST